jgi:hypothetical protein
MSQLQTPPRRIMELGAGDGTLMLRLARSLQPSWFDVELTLLDRHDLISTSVRNAFLDVGWRVTVECADVLDWVRLSCGERYDLCIATLFLHHFDWPELAVLLEWVAARTDALIACEPRRNWVAQLGSRLVGVLGANEVTREDAIKSVSAGFSGSELTQVWSQFAGDWEVSEYAAWPFSHCFATARRSARTLRGTQGV